MYPTDVTHVQMKTDNLVDLEPRFQTGDRRWTECCDLQDYSPDFSVVPIVQISSPHAIIHMAHAKIEADM